MRTQIRGLNRASLNIQDGSSLLQVGDGALQGVHDKMQRLRELAVQAANDTNDDLDRAAIQMEFGQITSEINKVMSQTNFNGRVLFDGSIGASWEYNLGQITIPYETTITAAAPFGSAAGAPVDIPGWSFTLPNPPDESFGVRQFIWSEGGGFVNQLTPGHAGYTGFPDTGIFAIQIVTPADGTLNVIMDFAAENPSGDMTIADFDAYFTNAFNNLGLGHVVDSVQIRDYAIVVNFPSVPIPGDPPGRHLLTGVMGRPGAGLASGFSSSAAPNVRIGLGPDNAEQLNSLNGILGMYTSPPFRTHPAGFQGNITNDDFDTGRTGDVPFANAPAGFVLTPPRAGA